MAQVDIGETVNAGLRLIGRRRGAALAWGVLPTLWLTLLLALFGPGFVRAVSDLAGQAAGSVEPRAIVGLAGGLIGFALLLALGMLVIVAVISAAAIRATLAPERRGFAYLGLGAEVWWVLAGIVVLAILLSLVAMILGVPLALIAVASGVRGAWRMHQGVIDWSALSGFLAIRLAGQVVIEAVVIWLWCRLAPGIVATWRERQFRLFESWPLTRNHAWRIFLAMLLVWLISFTIDLIVLSTIAIVAVACAAGAPGITDPATYFARPPAAWMGPFVPAIVVSAIGLIVMAGAQTALRWGALASIWRQLGGDEPVKASP